MGASIQDSHSTSQPLCEKDVNGATYAYLFVDVPRLVDRESRQLSPTSETGAKET